MDTAMVFTLWLSLPFREDSSLVMHFYKVRMGSGYEQKKKMTAEGTCMFELVLQCSPLLQIVHTVSLHSIAEV